MFAIPYDTLIYTHELTDTGMPREQAEKVAKIQKDVFEAQNQHIQETLDKAISTHLATKEDILGAKSILKEDILNLKHELKHDNAKLDKKIDLLRKEFEGKFNLLYWILGFILAFCVSIAFKLYF